MEGLINATRSCEFRHVGCPWRFQTIYKGIPGFCTTLGAIGPLTSMLEDEQLLKHGGRTAIASTMLPKSLEEHKKWRIKK
jgi:hypothetical protein